MTDSTFDLWIAQPANFADLQSECAALLTYDEQRRWQAFRFERDRLQFLTTRVLVRRALSHSVPLAPHKWHFTTNRHGKPATDPPGPIEFNLSNSHELVACLLSRHGAVGIDLEPLARAKATLEVARRVFSPAELAELDALPEAARPDRGLTLWTLKEAYTKALGRGITVPLEQITFQLDGPQGLTLTVPEEIDSHPGRWRFDRFDLAAHRLALCVEAHNEPTLRLCALDGLNDDPRPLPPPTMRWLPWQAGTAC